ncbi:hypothetical protein L226DRAFT_559744 [Lentinus tigrinus ALCF2SS1-7]|uniref:DUF6534 domain-containing protein n=1 Tax=Lentinus tigrinus ALCF2SS1-6 TaxID=1328759 RepID=A0A5C2SBV7_9APHY|nr:hypothetical protein L227DRAFT_91760 [Lentinus tigrinus ALCF2SS1-6]RPD75841.1 hypothetical protein L226DRAFT_559744 [Lentinus tigrinus ALCF2SS1-7]
MASQAPNATVTPAASPASSMTAELPRMDDIYGALLLGTFACVLLQGMVFHQTYRYFKLYPKDATYLKLWVTIVNVIELVTTAMSMHACYYYMVSHAFDPTVLLKIPVWSVTWLPIPGSLAAVSVELFFARRLWLVGARFRPVVVLAILLNLGFFSCFTAMAVLSGSAADPAGFLRYSYLASVAAGLIGISDVMVTASLIYVLHTRRTGIKQTNSKIDLLIKYAVSTGLIICVFNVLNVSFSIAHPHNWIYAGISIAMTKLYANTFLVSLNARHSLISSDILRMEQTTGFADPTNVNSQNASKFTTHLAFATPSAVTSNPSHAAYGVHTATGSVIELKHMPTSGNESELDILEFKRPQGRGGGSDSSV